MQYLCIQTGWAPPPACGPPTVFCAMKPRSQPFQGRDTAPIWNPDHHQTLGSAKGKHALTIRLPTPPPPGPPSSATGGPADYRRLSGRWTRWGAPTLSLLLSHSWGLLPSQGLLNPTLPPLSHSVLLSRALPGTDQLFKEP